MNKNKTINKMQIQIFSWPYFFPILLIFFGILIWIIIWQYPSEEGEGWPVLWKSIDDPHYWYFLGGLIWRIGIIIDSIAIVSILSTMLPKMLIRISFCIIISSFSAAKGYLSLFFNIITQLNFVSYLASFIFSMIQIIVITLFLKYIYFPKNSPHEKTQLSTTKKIIIFCILFFLDSLWNFIGIMIEAFAFAK